MVKDFKDKTETREHTLAAPTQHCMGRLAQSSETRKNKTKKIRHSVRDEFWSLILISVAEEELFVRV